MSNIHRTLTLDFYFYPLHEKNRTKAENEDSVCSNFQAKCREVMLMLTVVCFVTEEDVIAVYKEAFRSMERV